MGGEAISWVLAYVRRADAAQVVHCCSSQYNVPGLVSLASKHGVCMFPFLVLMWFHLGLQRSTRQAHASYSGFKVNDCVSVFWGGVSLPST